MKDRITDNDLDIMLARYARALDGLRITLNDGERIGLDHGSKTYGRAFRLFVTGEYREDGTRCTGHSRPPVGDDYLGMTKREAFDTLADRCRVMEDVAYVTR